ncbi:hypothetical protein BVY04_00315 [bacterium M21]|nr:hypothetical protein BVY04_00315 [bacterium M21]
MPEPCPSKSSSPPAGQSFGEEIANGTTHAVGAVLSIAGLALMMVGAASRGNAWHITSCAIFGATLIILYVTSAVYHFINLHHAHAKRILRMMDHISIYLLIAGTYTTLTLTFLRGPLGWTLFGIEWGLAVLGIVFKGVFGHRYDGIATAGYVVMGWAILIASYPMIKGFPPGGIAWLVAGGLGYTLGVPFYIQDKKQKYFHAIWHLFVLTGSICHFFMVYLYIIP